MFRPRDISFHIISLGCAKNLCDSEKLQGDLLAAGFRASGSADAADIIIINTCGFITAAKEESIDEVLEAASLQGSRGGGGGFAPRVAVTGCLSKRYFGELAREIPEIDFLYGIPDGRFVPLMCRTFDIEPPPARWRGRVPLEEGMPYRYLKIADGCSNNCSYCAIPLIRGPVRSFPPDGIVADARDAVSRGARELVIVAQDIAAYRHGRTRLTGLVRKIADGSGAEWIRLMYCHPDHVDGAFLDAFKVAGVVPYIDIPFQHASAGVLRSMGRAGSARSYLELVSEIRRRVPGIRIRSTFMVGYPGETERDFARLMAFVEKAGLDRAGAFMYSPEEGTRAFGMKDTVSPSEKRRRYRAFMKAQEAVSARKLRAMEGAEVRVLVEGAVDGGTFFGRSEYDAPEVDGIFYLTGGNPPLHSIVRARVTGSTEHDLIGVAI